MSLIRSRPYCINTAIWAWPWVGVRPFSTERKRPKRSRSWHWQFYYKHEYKKLFSLLDLIDKSGDSTAQVGELFVGNRKACLEQWRELMTGIKQAGHVGRIDRSDMDQTLKPICKLLAKALVDWPTFDKFYEPISGTVLELEMVPEFVHYLCYNHSDEMAHEFLHHIENDTINEQGQHRRAITTGVNVLLGCYLRKRDWTKVCRLVDHLTLSKLELSKDNANLLSRVPKTGLVPVYQSLLAKRVDFSTPAVNRFINNVMSASDLGQELVINTDRAMQEIREGSLPAFHSDVYETMIRKLSRQKNKDQTAWLLENVWLRNFSKENWALLLYRAMEVDGIKTAGTIYDFMTAKKVEPVKPVLLCLLRGFRTNALEQKFFEVCSMVQQRGWFDDDRFVVEVLALLADRYDASVVVDTLNHVYPTNQLNSLGIENYMYFHRLSMHSDSPVQPPSLAFLPVHTRSQQAPKAAISVVYRSVLNAVEDIATMAELYYAYFAQPTISLRIIDLFVTNLCVRFRTQEGIDLAHKIFTNSFNKPVQLDPAYKSRAPSFLINFQCTTIRSHQDGVVVCRPNPQRAYDIINLITTPQHQNHFKITHSLFEPVINYHKRNLDDDLAQQWTEKAQQLGANVN